MADSVKTEYCTMELITATPATTSDLYTHPHSLPSANAVSPVTCTTWITICEWILFIIGDLASGVKRSHTVKVNTRLRG